MTNFVPKPCLRTHDSYKKLGKLALPSDSCDKHAMVTSMCIFPVPKKTGKTYSKYRKKSCNKKHPRVIFEIPSCFFLKNVPPPPKKKTETSLQPTASQRTVERSHLHLEGVTFHEGTGPSPGSEAKIWVDDFGRFGFLHFLAWKIAKKTSIYMRMN